ncbi:hypothetical protein FOVSG1_004712 [Fusarium oxysporum f. sp. vasinfectum]
MEGRSPDDGLLSMSEEDFVLDFASDDLDSLPWNAPYGTNDAAFADVHQETTFSDTVDSINSNSFDIYSDHINPILNNTQELPALDTTYFDILLMNWDFMATPTDPITTTHAGSITTTEQSNCSTTYTSSSSPMTESSPIGLSQSQVSDPLSTKDAENVSITIARRRRTKMEPGTRPCDLKRQKRKEDKPEKCHICEKGHQWKRDLERHYRSNHPDEAAKMGLSRSKPICRHCGKDFARRDHLKRHLKRKHGVNEAVTELLGWFWKIPYSFVVQSAQRLLESQTEVCSLNQRHRYARITLYDYVFQ